MFCKSSASPIGCAEETRLLPCLHRFGARLRVKEAYGLAWSLSNFQVTVQERSTFAECEDTCVSFWRIPTHVFTCFVAQLVINATKKP